MRKGPIPAEFQVAAPLGPVIYGTAPKNRANFETERIMQMKWMQAVVALIGFAAVCGAAAQEPAGATRQANAAARQQESSVSESQFDLGVNFYNAFTSGTSGFGTVQTPKNAVGGMFEVRYIMRPLLGFEMTYSYNSADQTFAPKAGACYYACANSPTSISGKASEIGLGYVVSKKFGSLRPFAVGGVGFFITSAAPSTYQVNTVVRPAYIFGGGTDWGFLPHLGLRVQFRDNIYKAPNLAAFYPSTGQWTYSAEPMGGVYYNF